MKRALYVTAAFTIVVASVASGMIERAYAAGQVTSRSIRMSNSNQGTTGVTYRVSFNVPTAYGTGSPPALKGIVVDFCDSSPLPGDSCTLPTGFSLTGSPAIANASPNPTGNWTAASSNTNRTLTLTNSTGLTSLSVNDTVSFEITTVTNPTTDNHSFYARIFTYTSTTTGYTTGGSGNEGAYIDYGGIAMSTGKVINITAKVQETLSFCVYNTTCGDDPSFTIGHTAGTTTIIDSSVVDTSTAKFSLSTNANGGVALRMKGDTLKSGANDIDPRLTPAAIVAGTENFGFYVSTAGTNITTNNSYGTTASTYQLINTGGGAGDVTTTYGGQFATLGAPTTASITTLTFGATASNTTPAGTYTASEQIIATGTF
jgi:hypothetical protein